jgi:hypothetical protein
MKYHRHCNNCQKNFHTDRPMAFHQVEAIELMWCQISLIRSLSSFYLFQVFNNGFLPYSLRQDLLNIDKVKVKKNMYIRCAGLPSTRPGASWFRHLVQSPAAYLNLTYLQKPMILKTKRFSNWS